MNLSISFWFIVFEFFFSYSFIVFELGKYRMFMSYSVSPHLSFEQQDISFCRRFPVRLKRFIFFCLPIRIRHCLPNIGKLDFVLCRLFRLPVHLSISWAASAAAVVVHCMGSGNKRILKKLTVYFCPVLIFVNNIENCLKQFATVRFYEFKLFETMKIIPFHKIKCAKP